ncbi:MFS transporter [Deinococcus metallilatus]|uniref:MFS transporter n=1 Tax=Deinococcus metallilatus TaxID=1211322 RepID=A0AAJ5JXZ4_9DEIO|nr:MFS transporter [Deinococcus metallilatus]MBB5296046.1 FSR family fosmidomycin resistance protein-like MFS transporter [Deinococcus metallilatus]QBY08142.1 MFS transporter [Deinococcus metallilatus]RXJ11874.1 MFS transporter [Deinococcus metallilatus]TLK25894.1 MFS transporter [Deinococcus metallilatus]GMA14417.1 MFS transporter [Deinococcus metallilatus]
MQATAAYTAARHATAIAVAVTAGHFINDAYGAMLTPLTPALQGKFGVSIAAVTLLSSVYSLTSSVLQPLLGILGERVDRRYAAALGPLMTGLGLTLLGFVPWFGALVLLVAVAGFGSGFFHPSGAAYVALNSPPQKRGLWASLFSAGGTAGMALGPVFAGVGLTHLPWFALIGAVVAALTFAVTPSSLAGGRRVGMAEYARIFRGPLVWLWGMAVLRSLASMGYNAMLPFILMNRGFGMREVGITLAVYAIASAVGGIVGGRASDRYGRVPVLRSAILSTIPPFALLIMSSPANWWFYPLTFLVGAAVNASIPVGVVAAQEYAPGHVAVASSIMMGFSWGFAGLLVFLVGALADGTTPTIAALVSLTLLIPSALIAYRLPEPRKAAFE